MKLTQGQQEVVNNMRDGYLIRHNVVYKLVNLSTREVLRTILPSTFQALLDNNVIVFLKKERMFTYYQLTEQYKNKPDGLNCK